MHKNVKKNTKTCLETGHCPWSRKIKEQVLFILSKLVYANNVFFKKKQKSTNGCKQHPFKQTAPVISKTSIYSSVTVGSAKQNQGTNTFLGVS